MSSTLALNVAAGIAVVAGLGLLGTLLYAITVDEEGDEASLHLLLSGLLPAAVAVLIVGMHVLSPGATLWTWRIAGAVGVIAAAIASSRVKSNTAARWAAALSVAVSLVIAGASFFVQEGFARSVTAVTVPLTPRVINIQGVSLWYSVSVGMLALFTVVFLALFIRAMERGSVPQFETHWGGIGGGITGWGMSRSLTYLVGATVFGVLFTIFVFQLKINQGSQSSSNPPPSSATIRTPASTQTPPGEAPTLSKETTAQGPPTNIQTSPSTQTPLSETPTIKKPTTAQGR